MYDSILIIFVNNKIVKGQPKLINSDKYILKKNELKIFAKILKKYVK